MGNRIRLEDLKINEKNPRTIDGKTYIELYNSVEKFGLVDPIIINMKTNQIIGGHQRYDILIDKGIEDASLIDLGGIGWVYTDDELDIDDETTEMALNVALNNIKADWDYKLLDELMGELDTKILDVCVESIVDDVEDDEEVESYFTSDEIKERAFEEFVEYGSIDDFVRPMMSEPYAMYSFNELCRGKQKGYNISILFNPHRMDTKTVKTDSVYNALKNHEKSVVDTIKVMIDVYKKCSTKSNYYKYTGIGTGNYQYVNEFQPLVARKIYSFYCSDGSKILNPCAGWGGRVIGLASCGFENVEYWETDPQPKTYDGLLRLKEFLKLGDNYKTFNEPIEDLKLPKDYFDFAFTSPPYFDTERYGGELQSYNTNSNYEDWEDGFLKPMIDKILYSLKSGGKGLLNVGNRKYPIDSSIVDYLKENGIEYSRRSEFKIGGSGIGERAGKNGEPFIEFTSK